MLTLLPRPTAVSRTRDPSGQRRSTAWSPSAPGDHDFARGPPHRRNNGGPRPGAVFATAAGATITDENGTAYLDFFSGAGALSYGHNHPELVRVAVEHLRSGRVTHSLDTFTPEKRAFLETVRDRVLRPRNLDMVLQFVGPTGATAVEAALRLAERVTGRHAVVAYEGGYHGMTARAASVSASLSARRATPPGGTCTFLPYVGPAERPGGGPGGPPGSGAGRGDAARLLGELLTRPPGGEVVRAVLAAPDGAHGAPR
jgi:4-aminobutyrate aminotransferase-like enzyme